MEVGVEQLRRLRTERGLTQVKLAVQAGIDPSTLNQIENGRREPTPATLRKLAAVLDVSYAELLGETPKVRRRSEYEPSFNDALAAERHPNFGAVAAALDQWTEFYDRQVRVEGVRLDRAGLLAFVVNLRAIVMMLHELLPVDEDDRRTMRDPLRRFVLVAYAVGEHAHDPDEETLAGLADALEPLAA